jgi:hypothetical protein
MKSYFIIGMLILPLIALAQVERIEVPWKVKIQFMDEYVSASRVTWQRDGDNNYNVTFFHQSQNKSVTYSSEGLMLVTKTKLTSLFQVPEKISRSTRTRFAKYIIEDISKIESSKQITYEIIARRERNAYNLIFDPSGKLKKKRL